MNPLHTARSLLRTRVEAGTDAELLHRFVSRADPDAFAMLVRRFGPLVHGTCRRVLGTSADADDAFQTVFLILARRAESIRDAAALPAWLHRVSLRVSRKTLLRRLPSSKVPEAVADPSDPFADAAWKDVRRVLDEELDKLPERCRSPILLCWLEGLTQDEAAGRLKVSLTTLKRRLESGRELLRERLLRRGIGPALAALAVLDPGGLRANVPPELVSATERLVHSGASLPQGFESLAAAPTSVVRVLAAAAVAVCVSIAFAAFAGSNEPVAVRPVIAEVAPVAPTDAKAEVAEEPLPKHVTARFGSLQFRRPDRLDGSALSPDGKLLAVYEGQRVHVYEAATWKLVHRFIADDRSFGHSVFGGTMAFSPSGHYLAFAKNSQMVYLWNLRDGTLANRFEGERGRWVQHCIFTSDGMLALADKQRLYFFDPATGREIRSAPVTRPVIAISPDGATFARLGKADDPIHVVLGDAKTGKDLHSFDSLVRWTSENHGVSFSPDGKTMTLLPAHGKELQLWDVATQTKIASLPANEEGDTHRRGGPTAGFAIGGKVVWMKLKSGDLARWDAETRKPLLAIALSGEPKPAALHSTPDGKLCFMPCWNGWVRAWDAETGRERTVAGRYGHRTVMKLTPDGKSVVVGDMNGRIDFLDASTGKLKRTLREKGEPVTHLVLDSKGEKLAISESRDLSGGSASYRTRVMRTADGSEVRILGEEPKRSMWGDPVPVGFSADGKQLVTIHWPGQVRLWELSSGKSIRETGRLNYNAAPSPDGRLLAVEDDYDVALIEAETGKELRRFPVDPESRKSKGVVGGYQFAWAADGKTLAVGLSDYRLVILDPLAGREVRRFEVPSKEPLPHLKEFAQMAEEHFRRSFGVLALSYDGTRAVVANRSRRAAIVWDVATGGLLAVLPHEFQVDRIEFAPDGKSVFTFGSGGIGYRWDLDAVLADKKR